MIKELAFQKFPGDMVLRRLVLDDVKHKLYLDVITLPDEDDFVTHLERYDLQYDVCLHVYAHMMDLCLCVAEEELSELITE